MRPIKYSTHRNGDIDFHYKISDLLRWYRRGKQFGDSGPILVGRRGNFEVFKSFGTIENPRTEVYTINMSHNEIFDGKRKTPDEVINPKLIENPLSSYKMIFIDLSEYQK